MTAPPHPDWIVPGWQLPRVRAFVTTRAGGVSTGPYGQPAHDGAGPGGGLNISLAVGDDPAHVAANRALLRACLPGEPRWLRQVHGSRAVDAAEFDAPCEADASFVTTAGIVCAVSIADCLPVFLADAAGRGVAVAHAGWRGLAAGVIQETARALDAALAAAGARDVRLLAFLGPGIGPARFEVGPDVLDAMRAQYPDAARAFVAIGERKYLADLPALARQALAQAGAVDAGGGTWCTAGDAARFYSFRRDGRTGRHAAVIWLEP